MKRETIVKLSAVIITVLLVAILLSQISINDVVKTLASTDPIYLIIGFIFYLCSYFFRALRFHILLNHKVRLKHLLSIVCVHNMANILMPARTGEVSYVYLIKKLYDIPTGEGIATLTIARVFDLITISLLFFIAALNIGKLPDIISMAIWVIVGFMILIVMILIALVYFGERFMNIIKKIVNITVGHRKWIQYLLRKGDESVQSFKVVKSRQVIMAAGITSIGLWMLIYLSSYCLIYAFGINLNIFEIIILCSFGSLLPLLPFYGIGGFGTSEATSTVIMVSFGVTTDLAIIASFGMHIISLVYVLVLGVFGAWALKFKINIFSPS